MTLCTIAPEKFLQLSEAEFAVFKYDIAMIAAFLGDGYGAGIYIGIAAHILHNRYMGMSVEQDIALAERRQAVAVELMTVGSEDGHTFGADQGILRHYGETKHHLIHLGIAVATNAEYTVFQQIKHCDDLFGSIVLGQIVAGTVV